MISNGVYEERSKWGAKPAKCSSSNPTKKYIAIHHTAGPNNDTYSPEARLRYIQVFHQDTRGWCDIAYHLIVSQDGRVWEGRPTTVLGSHVGGSNTDNLGLCMMGDFTQVAPPSAMMCGLKTVLEWAITTFSIPRNRTTIRGHQEHPNQSTACPGTYLQNQIDTLVTASTSSYCSTTALASIAKITKTTGLYGSVGTNAVSSCVEQSFQVEATFENTGTTSWEKNSSGNVGQSVQLVFVSGETFGISSPVTLSSSGSSKVDAGKSVAFLLQGKTPKKEGTYSSTWQLEDQGKVFGASVVFSVYVSAVPAGSGEACQTAQKGVCAAGKKQCSVGKLQCLSNQTASQEVCDGLDNDCNGQIDENCTKCQDGASQECYSGIPQTAGKGLCKKGLQTCKSGQWGTCVGEVLPSIEQCDQKDNDCNGQIDEGCSCEAGKTRECYSAAEETAGKGLCKKGLQTCKSGQWGSCVGEILPVPENCNQKDDNCDGQIDNGCDCKEGEEKSCYFGPSATQGKGLCVSGIQTCVQGAWSSCVNQVLPALEKCDGLDNDCDGQIDNGNPEGQQACSTGELQCPSGTTQCIAGKVLCSPPSNCLVSNKENPIQKDAGATEVVLLGKKCNSQQDCEESEECQEQICRKKEEGCGCSTQNPNDSLLGLLVILLWGFFWKRRQLSM